jgi:hypothetical protein
MAMTSDYKGLSRKAQQALHLGFRSRTAQRLIERLATLGLDGFRKQAQRIKVKASDDPFDASERQVALAPLDGAHVGPVNTQDVGERLLAQSSCLPVSPQIASNGPLKIPFHVGKRSRLAT